MSQSAYQGTLRVENALKCVGHALDMTVYSVGLLPTRPIAFQTIRVHSCVSMLWQCAQQECQQTDAMPATHACTSRRTLACIRHGRGEAVRECETVRGPRSALRSCYRGIPLGHTSKPSYETMS